MIPSLPIRRLYWKDARQLLPLLMLLGASAIVFHLIGLLESDSNRPTHWDVGLHYAVFIALPILLAVGAGALIIGQEKELRTIQWLSSLPIRPQDLIRVKLVSCLLGLLAAWLLSGAMMLVVGLIDSHGLQIPTSLQGESASFFLTWPLHSLSLLLSGVAIAWYSRSSLTGIIILIPVAILPGFAADGFEYVYDSYLRLGILSPSEKFIVLSTIQIGICLTAYWLSWRLAMQALSAQVIESGKLNLLKTFGYSRSIAESKAWKPRTILYPASALVWQSFRQNRKVLLGTVVVMVATFAYGLRNEELKPTVLVGPVWFPFMLTAFFGTCWIGILTFQSDQVQRRIGFLSQRGVSVTLTWLTRQLVPISILCTVIIVCYSMFFWNHDSPRLGKYTDPFVLVSLVALVLASYTVSQWVGQIFANPIVAALASPPIAVATFYYLSFAWGTLSAPLWLIVLCSVIPLLATWATMRRWMDSRLDKVFWSTHFGFLLAFLFVPTIPMAATVLMLPSGMSSEIAMELAAEAAKYKDYDRTGEKEMLSMVISRPTGVGVKLEPSETLASLRQQVLTTLQQRVLANNGPLWIGPETIDYIIAESMLSVDRLTKRSIKEVVETDAETNDAQQYQALLKLASDIVVRTRLCHSIFQQDLSDRIEIWLLSELQRAKGNPIMMEPISGDLYATIAKRLSNSNDRNDARRRAVALSWQESRMLNRNFWKVPEALPWNSFGQYYLDRPHDYDLSWVNLAIQKHKVSSLASELWMLVKAGSRTSGAPHTDSKLKEILEAHWSRIAAIVEVPIQFYGIGSRGEFLRADNTNRFVFETTDSQRRAPASQWFADWERQAAALVMKESP